MRVMTIVAQMFSEPEYVSLTVTFLLMLALFRFWPVITLFKPKMLSRAEAVYISHLTTDSHKETVNEHISFVVNWIVATLKNSQSDDEENHCSLFFDNVKVNF
jgi:hypothetical protein